MDSRLFADIILPVPLPKLFSYHILPEQADEVVPGKRVVVQFGKKNFYTGIVRRVHSEKPVYETKAISYILDSSPIISDKMFMFWEQIAEYYMCTIGEVYKAALPSGMKPESETVINFSGDDDGDFETNEKETGVLNLIKNRDKINLGEIQKKLEFNILPVIKSLIDKGLISTEEVIKERYKTKKETYIRLGEHLKDDAAVATVLDNMKRSPKQSELLMSFLYMSRYGSERFEGLHPFSEIKQSDLLLHADAAPSTLDALLKKGILVAEKKDVSRLLSHKENSLEIKELNISQTEAFRTIKTEFEQKNVVLFHGVTSSGKTEIYIHLISEYIARGKQILYLLPEIALTTQITNRLRHIFGDKLGIYHSKFNDSERVEIWNNLDEKTAIRKPYSIILGVRSAIFLPFSDLGLIIVDEEHENTFKQSDPAPRYHARDFAAVLAKIHNARVLLGTATPSIESAYNAQARKYGLVELKSRYRDIELPEIVIADIAKARKRKQLREHFTPELYEAVSNALINKTQVILFQNRRGFAPFAECDACGWVPKCEHCDVSLTYHKHSGMLTCHYCGFGYAMPHKCKACESPEIRAKGLGTERIEEEIAALFPEARLARMDTDSTRNRNSFQKIITDFEIGKIDILIGTQMVSKGLDFDNVSVVGIMNADSLLNFPDFRAHERSFQLLTQVAGRAGRKGKRGKVILQTSGPEHPVIRQIIDNDYKALYRSEIQNRMHFQFPPFYRLISLTVKHADKILTDICAEKICGILRKGLGNRVLGPEYPPISRIQNKYIKNILIKIEREKSVIGVKKYLSETLDMVKNEDSFKQVQFVINIDP